MNQPKRKRSIESGAAAAATINSLQEMSSLPPFDCRLLEPRLQLSFVQRYSRDGPSMQAIESNGRILCS